MWHREAGDLVNMETGLPAAVTCMAPPLSGLQADIAKTT